LLDFKVSGHSRWIGEHQQTKKNSVGDMTGENR
jgi:hypothetical protein